MRTDHAKKDTENKMKTIGFMTKMIIAMELHLSSSFFMAFVDTKISGFTTNNLFVIYSLQMWSVS